jgi:hypothetical protein
MDQYQFVSDACNRNTRQGCNFNLYQPSTHLSLYEKDSYYMDIKLFSCLPLKLKQLYNDVKYFKIALKEFLCCHSFYILKEYFQYSDRNDILVPWWYVVRIVCKLQHVFFWHCWILACFFVSICYLHFFEYKHICTAFIHT